MLPFAVRPLIAESTCDAEEAEMRVIEVSAVVPEKYVRPTLCRPPAPTPPLAGRFSWLTSCVAACCAQYRRVWPPDRYWVEPMLPDVSMMSSTSSGVVPQAVAAVNAPGVVVPGTTTVASYSALSAAPKSPNVSILTRRRSSTR